jgi:ribosomal protein S18 acetylase RimI-like enzyme
VGARTCVPRVDTIARYMAHDFIHHVWDVEQSPESDDRAMDTGVSPVETRIATARDVDAIAHLHAESWRRNYRGAYLDSYLDGDVVTDRIAVWTERIVRPVVSSCTVVAEHDGAVVGFVHTVFEDDPKWGALLDNLHVTHEMKGRGVGTMLTAESAHAVLGRDTPTGVYLWVLEQNESAQAFYRARGGTEASRELRGPFPGGGTAYALRMVWPDPSTLLIR